MNNSIWRLRSTPDGCILFSCGANGSVASYDATEGRYLRHHKLGKRWINALTYADDLSQVAMGTSGGNIFFFTPSLELITETQIGFWINGISRCSTQGSWWIVTAEGVVVKLIQNGCDWKSEMLQRHTGQIWDCDIGITSEVLATAGDNGEIGLWNSISGAFLRWLSKGGYTVTAIVLLERIGAIASVDMGGILTVWDLNTGHVLSRFKAHEARIWSISAAKDQSRVVTVAADRSLRIWAMPAGQLVQECILDCSPISCFLDDLRNLVHVGDRAGAIHSFPTPEPDSLLVPENSCTFSIASILTRNRIVVFMRGTRKFPRGIYSRRAVEVLENCGIEFFDVDIDDDVLIRMSIERISGCPIFPQIYIDGNFLGGSEVLIESVESGWIARLMLQQRTLRWTHSQEA